jgi:hypothetical protein
MDKDYSNARLDAPPSICNCFYQEKLVKFFSNFLFGVHYQLEYLPMKKDNKIDHYCTKYGRKKNGHFFPCAHVDPTLFPQTTPCAYRSYYICTDTICI